MVATRSKPVTRELAWITPSRDPEGDGIPVGALEPLTLRIVISPDAARGILLYTANRWSRFRPAPSFSTV